MGSLVTVAKSYGLKAKMKSSSVSEVSKLVNSGKPVIVNVNTKGY